MNFKLIAKRKERGLKQEEVAAAIGVSAMAISHYENGTRTPRADIKKKLADFYGCEGGELFGTMAGFKLLKDDGELNVEGYAKFLEQNQPEVDGVKSFPIEWFDSAILIEIHQMLKKLTNQRYAPISDEERINAIKVWFACRNEIQPDEVFAEIKERKSNGQVAYHVKYNSPVRGDNDKIVVFADEILNEFCQYLEEYRQSH